MRSKASYNGHGSCRRPAVLTAVLVIVIKVADMPTAELLQLLNAPVVAQLGGEGASLGPTTRQPCAST